MNHDDIYILSVNKRERKIKERERERDYKFIQKYSRGLNRVPARTYIFACLNQLSYRCHNIGRYKDIERDRARYIVFIYQNFRKGKDMEIDREEARYDINN